MWYPNLNRDGDYTVGAGDWGGPAWGYQDAGGLALPNKYYRTKEGVERFFITDINNPAGTAKAQSSIMVMFDAYSWSGSAGGSFNFHGNGQALIGRFNHAPGGSNVLYMDGHVQFVKWQQGDPLKRNAYPDASYTLSEVLSMAGGQG